MSGRLAIAVAVLAAAARADEEDDPKRARQALVEERPRRLHALAELGVAIADLHGVAMDAGQLRAGVEFTGRRFSVSGGLDGWVGRSANGLAVAKTGGSFGVDYVWSRLRIGGGAQISAFWLRRATSGSVITDYGLGLFTRAALDLLCSSTGQALFLGARAGFEYFPLGQVIAAPGSEPALLLDAMAFVGFRL